MMYTSLNEIYKLFGDMAKSCHPLPEMTESQWNLWRDVEPMFEYSAYMKNCPTEIQHFMKQDAFQWTTQAGETFYPYQMETRHILYCMRQMLKRFVEFEIQQSVDFIMLGKTLYPIAPGWDTYLECDPADFDEDVLFQMQMYHGYHAFYNELGQRFKILTHSE